MGNVLIFVMMMNFEFVYKQMGLTLITKCFWLEAKATNKRSIMSFRCSSLDQIITEKRIHCALVHLASVAESILVAMFTFTILQRGTFLLKT